jgi:PAS domain-containing protein
MTGPLLYKDGSERAVAHRGHGIFNEEGEPNALEGLITDITDYQRAQRELFEAS